MKNNPSVFITDAGYKHTLGVVRSLGRKGITIYCGSSSYEPSLCSFSRYVRQTLIYPDPKVSPELFSIFVKKASKKFNFNVVIPIGYNANYALSKYKDSINNLQISISDFKSFNVAAFKNRTLLLAKELKIPTPITFYPNSLDELDINLKYPVVVKGTAESGFVKYAKNRKELIEMTQELKILQGEYPLIQEKIPGKGYGFFALLHHGELRAMFMHKRIREYPLTGGPSTCAESIYEAKLYDYSMKLLKALKWHGVAMVEFKKDIRDNEFKLMEINPKFWGSLDLAISSGVDFPYLLYRMTTEGDIKPQLSYKLGVKFMWPFPDDFQRCINRPKELPNFTSDLFNPRIFKNIDAADLTPNLFMLFGTLLTTGRRVVFF